MSSRLLRFVTKERMAPKSSESFSVPRTYTELQQQYGQYIYKLLGRFNKIERNFEDLHNTIWLKLMEAKFLERFDEHIAKQVPKVLNALGACDLLGISWQQWRAAMHTYHKGLPALRDEDGDVIERKRGRWMPTPINVEEFRAKGVEGYASKSALFSFLDVIQLTLEERINGVIRRPFRVMGRMIDHEGNVVAETRPEGDIKIPDVKVTTAQFRNYLSIAVLNHYANFCRTVKRRHKERPHTPSAHQEDTVSWESTIQDPKAVKADTVLELEEARAILQKTIEECMDGTPTCAPLGELGAEVLRRLQEGQSLVQAFKGTDIPTRVRDAVVDTLRWVSSNN